MGNYHNKNWWKLRRTWLPASGVVIRQKTMTQPPTPQEPRLSPSAIFSLWVSYTAEDLVRWTWLKADNESSSSRSAETGMNTGGLCCFTTQCALSFFLGVGEQLQSNFCGTIEVTTFWSTTMIAQNKMVDHERFHYALCLCVITCQFRSNGTYWVLPRGRVGGKP
jgi:hypothetical protein